MSFNVLQSSLLPLNCVRLGRFVQAPKEPYQGFYDPFESQEPDTPYKTEEGFHESLKSPKAVGIRSRLGQLISGTGEGRQSSLGAISARQHKIYQLKNSTDRFNEACALPESRQWMEESISDGCNLYFTIGYKSLVDASIQEAAVSGTLAARATLTAIAPGAKHSKAFTARVEQVYAVQYRKVKFSWLSSRTIDHATLESTNRWKILWGVRGEDDNDGVDDVLEVDLEDGVGSEDEDLQALETFVTMDGSEVFLF